MFLNRGLGALDQLLELVGLGRVVRLAGQIEDGLVNGDFLIDVGAVEHRALRGRTKRRHLALTGGLDWVIGRSFRSDAELLGQSESLHPQGVMLSHHHLGKGFHIRIGRLPERKGSRGAVALVGLVEQGDDIRIAERALFGGGLAGVGGHSCCCGIAGSGSPAGISGIGLGFTRRRREDGDTGGRHHRVACAPC